ncbi:MAG: glycosyltransferase, partial [Candidatus Binatia bacterium]
MKVLYITYMGLTEPLLYSQGLAYLEGLSDKGHQITILSFEKKKAFEKNGEAISGLRARLEARGIEWYILRYHKRPYLFSTFFDLVQGVFTGAYLTIKKRVYLIHARGTVPAAIGFLLKRGLKVRLLFDVRGLMAEEYVDGGLLKRGGLIYRVTSRWEQRFLAQSDALIFLSHRILSFFQAHQPELFADHKTIEVIESCVDLNRFSIPKERDTELEERFGLKERFVFIYVGSFGTWYLLDEMLDFFKEARRLIPNAFFLIVTQSTMSFFAE